MLDVSAQYMGLVCDVRDLLATLLQSKAKKVNFSLMKNFDSGGVEAAIIEAKVERVSKAHSNLVNFCKIMED